MKFCFGDMVVVEDNLIGVVLTDWINPKNAVNPEDREVKHEVYVRQFREIREYPEDQIERYMVRHKYLEGEEITWQHNAVHNTIDFLDEPLTENEQKMLDIINQEIKNKYESKEYINGLNTSISVIVYEANPKGRTQTLRTRSYNAFLRARIYTLQDFFNKEPWEIKNIKNLGRKSLDYFIEMIFDYCKKHNIQTKYSIEDYNI